MSDFNMNHSPEESQASGFAPDYKFASASDIRALTINHLAKLEAELHTLRMMFIANGRNPNLIVRPERTLGSEMQKIQESIKTLSEYFRTVLAPDENV